MLRHRRQSSFSSVAREFVQLSLLRSVLQGFNLVSFGQPFSVLAMSLPSTLKL